MGIADEMNNENRKITKEDFKEYIYVMVSTLNQMVNYIPLKYFDFKEVYNLTVKEDNGDKKNLFDNKKWDKNLESVYDKSINHLEIDKQKFFDVINIKNFLQEQMENGKLKNKKIFWNITGGQRNFVLAINQVAKDDDIICYLEGNNNQMLLYSKDNIPKGFIEDYGIEDLTIETALKLMGFDIKVTQTSERNFITEHNKEEKKDYLNFLDEYIKNKKLRENLILLNRDKDKENAKKEIKKIIDISDEELNRNNAFGYILEKLAGYKILKVAKDKIADMTLSEKINYSRDEERVDSHIDEFDIALLTKNGKFMIFECKSGGMDGDVAKSTKYSTYAISGVYGLPILITPLLKEEIENIDGLNNNIYRYIKKAVKSAQRAGLDVWGLNEIEEKLKKYIDL